MIRFTRNLTMIATFSWLMCLADVASACPTCKDGLHQDAALGYAISIVFMMSMPLLITAFWVVLIWRLRAKQSPVSIPE